MSLRNFIRRFEQATGDSPLSYLQKLRVAAAKRLFESDYRTMQEISYAVGYQDVVFRKSFSAVHRCISRNDVWRYECSPVDAVMVVTHKNSLARRR